jgi:MOSC domain-containing protein YiiM
VREPRDLPADLPPFTGSAVACLASILELDASGIPAPAANHPQPWTVWRNWLAERGLGLVPIADPAGFSWPGPWLALLRGEERQVCAVAYGPPSTIVWHPLGGPETFADVEAGYVVAPADVALWAARERGVTPRTAGRVDVIAIAAAAEAPVELVGEAIAHAGRGLEGDRYHEAAGTFSNPHSVGHQLTLVEAEALEELGIAPEAARRNLVTRGIDLNALVGRRFTVGEVACIGRRLCEPCAHLERLSPGTLRPLVHRGGLRADLLGDGTIRVGDVVGA